jgi:hypothetical protein
MRDRKTGKFKQVIKLHGITACDIWLTEKQAGKIVTELKLTLDSEAREKSYFVYKKMH